MLFTLTKKCLKLYIVLAYQRVHKDFLTPKNDKTHIVDKLVNFFDLKLLMFCLDVVFRYILSFRVRHS